MRQIKAISRMGTVQNQKCYVKPQSGQNQVQPRTQSGEHQEVEAAWYKLNGLAFHQTTLLPANYILDLHNGISPSRNQMLTNQ